MAERRMFAKTIIDSDAFIDMPLSTQALYFHLSMRADDDGFINNPKKIQRMIGAADDDIKVLITKKFIIPFESGIVVIKHWKIHNYIQKDRYKPTMYLDEKSMLETKENKGYTLKKNECIQNVYKMDTQVRKELGKSEISKEIELVKDNNINNNKKENIKRKIFKKPTIEEINEYCKERNNGIDAEAFYDFYESKDWYVGKNKMKDWKACVRTWEKRNKPKEEKLPEWWNKTNEDFEEDITEDERREYEAIKNGTYKP